MSNIIYKKAPYEYKFPKSSDWVESTAIDNGAMFTNPTFTINDYSFKERNISTCSKYTSDDAKTDTYIYELDMKKMFTKAYNKLYLTFAIASLSGINNNDENRCTMTHTKSIYLNDGVTNLTLGQVSHSVKMRRSGDIFNFGNSNLFVNLKLEKIGNDINVTVINSANHTYELDALSRITTTNTIVSNGATEFDINNLKLYTKTYCNLSKNADSANFTTYSYIKQNTLIEFPLFVSNFR